MVVVVIGGGGGGGGISSNDLALKPEILSVGAGDTQHGTRLDEAEESSGRKGHGTYAPYERCTARWRESVCAGMAGEF